MNNLEGTPVRSGRHREARLFDPGDARPDRGRSQSALDDERSMLAETPDGDGFIALLKAFRGSGGVAPSDVFAPVFAQHQFEGAPTLQTHIDRANVFGFEWRNHFWIPLFQFDAERLTIRTSAREVRTTLPASWSGWHLAAWFARPHGLLDDRSPVDVLDRCQADVIRAAQWHRPQPDGPCARGSESSSA